MQKLTQIAAALIIGTTLSASVLAAGNTFVTVNGTAVSQNMADVFINEQKAQGAPDSAELKNAVREELVRRELLMQEAKKSGVDKKADVAAQAEAMRQSVIIRAYVQEFTKKNPISDASSSRNTMRSRHSLVTPSTRRVTFWSRKKPRRWP